MNQSVITQFRSGSPMRMPRDRMLLLTTTGRRTGQSHTTPMMFVRVGQRLIVVASNSGAANHPQWYLNLVADPAVTVETGAESYHAQAMVLDSRDRTAVWPDVAAAIPMYAQHQETTHRQIPLVELIRA